MKKFIFALFLLVSLSCWSKTPKVDSPHPQPTPNEPIDTALNRAFQKANQENKSVYLFLTEDNCIYCAKMKKSVLPNVDMSRVVFVECMDKDLHKRFGVEAFPTSVLLNKNGKEMKREVGYMTIKELSLWLSELK